MVSRIKEGAITSSESMSIKKDGSALNALSDHKSFNGLAADIFQQSSAYNSWNAVGSLIPGATISSIWSNSDSFSQVPNFQEAAPWSISSDASTLDGNPESSWMPAIQRSQLLSTSVQEAVFGDTTDLNQSLVFQNGVHEYPECSSSASNNPSIQSVSVDPSTSHPQPVSVSDSETERLIVQLVNSTEGWGSIPVDQSTPWEINVDADDNDFSETNVWKNEVPTGTGIWELHYNRGIRSGPHAAVRLAESPKFSSNSRIPIESASTFQPHFPRISSAEFSREDVAKFWNARPVLGASRNRDAMITASNWSSDNVLNGTNGDIWDDVRGTADRSTWHTPSSSLFHSPPGSSVQDTLNECTSAVQLHNPVNPSELVKRLLMQGFKKEDINIALVQSNMNPEEALNELTRRSSLGAMQHPSNCGISMSTQRINSSTTCNPPSHSLMLPPLGSTSNPPPHLIRHQLTQQVRSALKLSLPNSFAPTTATNFDNSILGQPPLTNGLDQNSAPFLSNSQHRSFSNTNRFALPTNMGNAKRMDRRAALLTAISDLQKKHQSIQQQLFTYRNNPIMCSQPQYIDVFAELQAQLQQLETQLKIKQDQLSLLYSQESRQSSSMFPDNASQFLPNSAGLSRFSQDHLVQQLMDLRVDPEMESFKDFPKIGVWNPSGKDSLGNYDNRMPRSDGAGSSNLKSNGASWNTGRWNSALRNRQSNRPPNGRPFMDDASPLVPDMIGSGQWLLIHFNLTNTSIYSLRNLLSQFGLTTFHLLGPTSAAAAGPDSNGNNSAVLAHIQSSELAVQLIRSTGDRLTIEPISETEAMKQLHSSKLRDSHFGHYESDVRAPNFAAANPSSWLTSKRLPAPNSKAGLALSGFH